ncbi:formate acetyltransferase 3 domain protein [Streptococcus pneumoniae GA17227]|nr:formate acetyltransferase 3 domain protein [Streptococcus pneumoniae GA41410]EHE06707.1 formate acetyltransferase 3 domain protein [Streptococcus pneumoniae GA17227]EHE13151.1 formate acetyltransferase 3 domain protein [Streptococcus pneumoniae GA17371]
MVNTEVARTTIKTEYFGSLTERMNKYREDVLNKNLILMLREQF